MPDTTQPSQMAQRFRSFLPVVVDVETGGFNAATDALLEIAAVPLNMDRQGIIYPEETIAFHVDPANRSFSRCAQGGQGKRLQACDHRWPQRAF